MRSTNLLTYLLTQMQWCSEMTFWQLRQPTTLALVSTVTLLRLWQQTTLALVSTVTLLRLWQLTTLALVSTVLFTFSKWNTAATNDSNSIITAKCALRHSHIFSGGGRDPWSLVRRGSQPHNRNWQKSHALHSRCVENYLPVQTYFSDNSAFQCCVPCQHVHSFRVPIVTIPDIQFYIC